ncbi:MAG: single-stranded DNA-binding protein [Oscillospiraceae bacterium]|nr:single-stranded DNA-binding protein [Oscillospiraceae bacterium]
MSDFNKCYFTGRLGKDPELRSTSYGTPVCTFSLAVERPKAKNAERGETDWIDFVAWRNTAEYIARYFSKGRKVVVEAAARTRKYEDKNGVNHKVVEFNVTEIQAADSRPQGNNGGGSYGDGGYQQQYTAPAQDNFTPLTDDDGELPF